MIIQLLAIFFGAKKTAAKETAARLNDEVGQAVEKPRSFVVAQGIIQTHPVINDEIRTVNNPNLLLQLNFYPRFF
ncbi:MAG: hypothetical protein ACE5EE_10655 [Fidelibacterota bacterium]